MRILSDWFLRLAVSKLRRAMRTAKSKDISESLAKLIGAQVTGRQMAAKTRRLINAGVRE